VLVGVWRFRGRRWVQVEVEEDEQKLGLGRREEVGFGWLQDPKETWL
jgi:hypothetical protein